MTTQLGLAAKRRTLTTLFALAALAGCGGGGGDAGGTPVPPPLGGGNGTLRAWLTDAPACGYDSVHVSVEKVRVHQSASADEGAAGWSEIVLSPARRIDLLSLRNGVLSELGQTTLAPGRYQQLRLVLATNSAAAPLANAVRPSGEAEVELKTPSAQQSGLKLNVGIDIAANQSADIVIDFDACKSVLRAGNSGNFILKPVLQATPRFVTGVQGFVEAALIGPLTTVSLQQGGMAIKSTQPDATGKFVLQPVAPGSYTLVLAAPGRTTLTVTGVAVSGSSLTAIGSSAVPLLAPASASGNLVGSVSSAVAPIDALVRVTQSLTGGAMLEWTAVPVNASTGAYAHSVPVAAPLVAAYVPAPAPLVFASDNPAAGRYTVVATSGGITKSAGPLTLAAGATLTNNFTFP
ncbi:DUF4382 domain-containing protein [Aquincola sp. S2]|uniref:DUF4382 domain-containing protein n=1 Tax=Pseudaquabacterium terrae TaxID=2732868 RepID=A0ABX2E9T1_9BURK|nr:DUF4382 domain-containing protein [Aquabacterium terrae]NRF65550.1 DUF4382 domain-containing protein [Aquabacterium terrae]